MADSERLRDIILGKAFKGVKYDSDTHLLEPEYVIRAYENKEIEKLACGQYGYTPEEYMRFKGQVMLNTTANTTAVSELTMLSIGNGDILQICGENDDTLRLLKLQGHDFLVLSDDTNDAHSGDVMTMLQYAIRIERPLLMQLRRGAQVIPSKEKAYTVGKVCRLEIMHSDTSLFGGYLEDSEIYKGEAVTTARKVYANRFDLKFNGFAGPQLEAEQRGQLYEIDAINLTYRVNPAFNPMQFHGSDALIDELRNGFYIEEEVSDFSTIAMVDEGSIKLKPRDGFYILSCERQATISLC